MSNITALVIGVFYSCWKRIKLHNEKDDRIYTYIYEKNKDKEIKDKIYSTMNVKEQTFFFFFLLPAMLIFPYIYTYAIEYPTVRKTYHNY